MIEKIDFEAAGPAPDFFIQKAKNLVAADFNAKFLADPERNVQHLMAVGNDFYVVWFAKILGNWKALVSTDILSGQYWEVTYNGEKKESYVDHYTKASNNAYSDAGYERRFVGAPLS